MKLGRGLILGIVVVALLLTAIGVAFSSGFQTWALRKALAGRPGVDVTLGRASVGWQHVRLENVRVVRDGAVLTLPAVKLELPVLSALRKKVLIRRLEARGWTLDLASPPRSTVTTAAPPTGTPTGPAPPPSVSPGTAQNGPPVAFAGIFTRLDLPVDLALAGVDLTGEIVVPALPGRPAARAQVTLTGGSLAAGQPGKFDYTATVRFDGEDDPVRQLNVRGTIGVVMDTARTFSRFVADTTAEATGPKLPEGVKLAVDVSAARSAAGENYAMAVLSGSKQLAAIETSYAAGQSHLQGAWRVDMHDTDLAPFVLGREMPVFVAVGEGRFDLDTTFAELIASGRLKMTGDRLAAIKPGLAVLGSVHLDAEFDLSQRGKATRVDRLAVTIAGTKPVATVRALQAFEFNLETGELNVADPATDLLGLSIQGLPLAWVGPLLAKVGFTFSGDDLTGEFSASARNGGFALRPKVPLAIGNLSVTLNDGRALLRAVDVTLAASADYTPQGWQLELTPLSASSQGDRLFALALKAGQLAGKDQPVKVAGDWTMHLPSLLAQPLTMDLAGLTGGDAQGEFAASLGVKKEIQVRLAVTNLAAGELGALPSLTTDLRADVDADGKYTFNIPVLIERAARKSDLTLSGTLDPGPGGRSLTARLASELLVIEDAKALSWFFVAPAGAAARPSARPTTPFWSGVSGQCTLAFKKMVYTDQFQVTEVSGILRLDPAAFKVVDLRAGLVPDSTVRVHGGLTFAPAKPQPYGMAADLALGNFDLAPVFRALNPTKPPTIEGRVDLLSHFLGSGATLAELARRTRGDLRVTGKSGIFRALSADMSDRIQRAQSRLVAIGSVLGILTDDYVNKTQILADIAQSLAEIHYDQLNMVATRDDLLNLVVKDFALISPELRLGGTGMIRHAAGVPIAGQPLELQLNLGARGRAGDLMKRAGLLDVQQDGLGYAAFGVPLKLGGTLAHPDTSAIRDALLNSALERSGLLDGLFRGK